MSNKIIIKITLTFLLVLSSLTQANTSYKKSGIATKTPNKILFVGNSFSFYNNGISNEVANLVRAKGLWNPEKNNYRLMTLSGGKLDEHSKFLSTFLEQKNINWDLVVLQEYSTGPIIDEKKSKFRAATKKLVKDIEASDSHASLFMTWAYQHQPEMIESLSTAYQSLGKELNIPVFPVGIAFSKAQLKHPEILLLVPDVLGVKNGEVTYTKTWKHPSPNGSYLAACVFYSVLYGESAEGNPYTATLPAHIAQKLQKTAWETVTEFY